MICVSIGRGRHRHMMAEHHHLAENGIELVELRLDCIQGTVQLKRLLKDRPCPVIITCRRQQDGGRWEHSEELRLQLLRFAIAEGADFVDLEDDIAGAIPRYGKTKRIVSHHDMLRTPHDLRDIHSRMASLDADVVKIATMANNPSDNLRMLDLVRAAKVPTVGVCMGDIGLPTRVLGGRAGAPFVYATFSDDRVLAPGQIGWRSMRDIYHYDAIGPETAIYGVVADPVAHSLSPFVHNAACAAAGIDAVYIPFRVPIGELEEFLDSAGRWPLAGVSVTIPHKEAVLPKVHHMDEMVTAIGAANTLTFTPDGIVATNTDTTAAIESLLGVLEDLDPETGEKGHGVQTALVLGAGGAARAIAFGLKQRGVDVTIAARTLERGRQVAADVDCKAVDWVARHRMPHDCIVNATPIGMHPDVDATPFEKEHLRPYMIVFDTVYNPENTLFVKEARAMGCRVVTGVEMFVLQAAIQFRTWHGVDPDHAVMREALKRATASAKPPA